METLKQYLYRNLGNYAAKTYLYRIEIFLMKNPRAKRFTYSDIINYIHEMKTTTTTLDKPSSMLSPIKRYYDYLLETGQRKDHPCKTIFLKGKKRDIQLQDLFTTSELELLMNRESRFADLELRDKVIISLLIYQALTASEVCRLELQNINLDEGTLYIKGSKKTTVRTLDLKPNQIMLIQKYVDTSRKNLLRTTTNRLMITRVGIPETLGSIYKMIAPLRALYPDRDLCPATIRQSVIANLLNEKKMPVEDVQLFAGHKYPSSTEKYKREDITEQRQKINRWHPLG